MNRKQIRKRNKTRAAKLYREKRISKVAYGMILKNQGLLRSDHVVYYYLSKYKPGVQMAKEYIR